MSRGDVHLFAAFQFKAEAGGNFNLTTDTLKLGIVTGATAPAIGTNDPRWGSGGATDFSANQVALGAGYAGPITLGSVALSRSGAVVTLAAANVVVPQDASGFSNGFYGILYDATVSGNYAIGYVDLGGPVGNVNGPINLNWNAAGIAAETVS
jgi:hypothetical protein